MTTNFGEENHLLTVTVKCWKCGAKANWEAVSYKQIKSSEDPRLMCVRYRCLGDMEKYDR